MKSFKPLAPLLAAAALSACQILSPVNLKKSHTLDEKSLGRVKSVAVMPFFQANAVGTDDPGYAGKYADAFPTVNVYESLKAGSRFKLIAMEDTVAALRKRGFVGIKLAPGEEGGIMKMILQQDKFRGELTMQAALGAGKDVKADAILIGAWGVNGAGAANMRYIMTMRLVDPGSGKVLWGGAHSEAVKASLLHPIETQKKQIRDMAAAMIAEAK